MAGSSFDVVIPTIGRASLTPLLRALDREGGPPPERVIIVDDRAEPTAPLPLPPMSRGLRNRMVVVASGGRGPAAARNAGWRSGAADWVAFVDDDVVPCPGWLAGLASDLSLAAPDVGASQGTVVVPMPTDRPPTDWERNVAALEDAPWITADMAYRRGVLTAAGGFDERFTRAFREDTDLALRVAALGWRLTCGRRTVLHPPRDADALVSLRLQRGNADDVLMSALHPGWRDHPPGFGTRRWHAITASAAVLALLAGLLGIPLAFAVFVGVWGGRTAAFAWRRIAPGPRTAGEIGAMILTSVAIPFAACAWWLIGRVRVRGLLEDRSRAPTPGQAAEPRLAAAR